MGHPLGQSLAPLSLMKQQSLAPILLLLLLKSLAPILLPLLTPHQSHLP